MNKFFYRGAFAIFALSLPEHIFFHLFTILLNRSDGVRHAIIIAVRVNVFDMTRFIINILL